MTDDAATRALRAAVASAPEDHDLRLILARRLHEQGAAAEALEECARILATEPAHVEALRLAADAATAAGLADRAVGYRRLVVALGGDAGSSELTSADIPDVDEGPSEADMVPASDVEVSEEAGPGYVEAPGVTLADVGGLEHVKRRLQTTFLGPLQHPELREAFSSSLRGGLMLYGPPGCGKTFLARALAGELRAGFISIGLTDVVDPYYGVSEQRLHELFEAARRAAPCVVFLDEIDALGQKRSQLRGSAGRGVVNQLLTEMDAVDSSNEGLFFLAATNHPWDVDTALRRPGRFDRTLLVLPPDGPAREAILRFHLRNRPVEKVDYRAIAKRTDGFSGADLAHVCETATQSALERSISGGGGLSPVTRKDLESAVAEVRPSTRGWMDMARNYALYANEGGEYDELAAYLRERRIL